MSEPTALGGSLPGDDGVGSKVPGYNEYLINVLEPAVRGINSKDLAARTTAYTLTALEARNARHVYTNVGAAIDIKYPLATTATHFVVKNSSGFTLTIKTDAGGSTGIAIPTGYIQPVWINGNNVEAAGPAVNTSAGAIGARVYHNAAQAISNITLTALAFNSERFDTDTIHDTATNNSRLTCKTPGKYIISGTARFANGAGNIRALQIRLNGGNYIAVQHTAPLGGGEPTGMTVNTIYDLALNDYVELFVYQDSGGNLNIDALAAQTPEFSMARIGT